MKNMKYFLSAISVVATLSGCGSWNQDPLAGKDEAFKKGLEKPTNGESPKPTDSQAVRLDKPDVISFREGVAGEFTMSARILEPGYTPSIFIENITDFPGAVFSQSAGKFFWTPPMGTVSGDLGTSESRMLKVRVVGNKPNGRVLTSVEVVEIKLTKVLNAPEIFQISKTSADMREGEMMNVTVKVRDKDAGTSFPSMQVLPIVGYGNISQFVTITQMLATGNNEYVINMSIDLNGVELTKSRERYGFKLRAISRFQQASADQDVYVNVLTSFADLQSTWFATLDVPLGLKKEFQFMIFDPKDELFVDTPTFTGLPYGATISCNSMNFTRRFCTFSWTPDFMVSTGPYTVTANVVARNQDSSDRMTKTYTFKLDLNVTSAPPVSPVALKGGQ